MHATRKATATWITRLILGTLFISAALGGREEKEGDPVSVTVIKVPSAADSVLLPTGNIRVTFAAGRSKMVTSDGDSTLPKISRDGKVGWLRVDKSQVDLAKQTRAGIDAVVILTQRGETKEFLPDPEAPFIGKWGFADNDTAITIQSSAYHGPRHYIKYDFKTHKVKDEIETYVPFEQLPSWAKRISDESTSK
jgi:hypothetical protein